jgi:hypothetical protein
MKSRRSLSGLKGVIQREICWIEILRKDVITKFCFEFFTYDTSNEDG